MTTFYKYFIINDMKVFLRKSLNTGKRIFCFMMLTILVFCTICTKKVYAEDVYVVWEYQNGDKNKPKLRLSTGQYLTSQWAYITSHDGSSKAAWYHFDATGNISTGWFLDETGSPFYSNTLLDTDGILGQMRTGWFSPSYENSTYYLNPTNGIVTVGWAKIDGKDYYFEPGFNQVYGYTYGQLYRNAVTPDGRSVDADGVLMTYRGASTPAEDGSIGTYASTSVQGEITSSSFFKATSPSDDRTLLSQETPKTINLTSGAGTNTEAPADVAAAARSLAGAAAPGTEEGTINTSTSNAQQTQRGAMFDEIYRRILASKGISFDLPPVTQAAGTQSAGGPIGTGQNGGTIISGNANVSGTQYVAGVGAYTSVSGELLPGQGYAGAPSAPTGTGITGGVINNMAGLTGQLSPTSTTGPVARIKGGFNASGAFIMESGTVGIIRTN